MSCVNINSEWRRKAGGRWVALSGATVITSCCIRRSGLRKENTCLGEGSGWTRAVGLVRLLAGCDSELFGKAYAISVFGMLTKWLHITRLETRTKETIMFASIWVENPRAQ